MKAAITGITGFAGEYLAEHLLAEGDEVLGFSRHGTWPEHTPAPLQERVPLAAWDITEPSTESGVLERLQAFAPDAIYHLAAMSVPGDCGPKLPSGPAAAVNVGGAAAMLELAAGLPRRPRVLFASTSHVYDAQVAAGGPMSEDGPIAPKNGYGWSKCLAEEVIAWFTRETGLDVVIARAFQHSGPRQSTRMMLPAWARQFVTANSQPIDVHNRTTRIDLTDVRDIVRAYRLLIERGTPGVAYNVGSGVPCQTGEVLELLRKLAVTTRTIRELHPGPRYDPLADIRRLVETTGWQPRISLEQCVEDTFDYWRRHAIQA